MQHPHKNFPGEHITVSVVIVTYDNLPEIGVCLSALDAALRPFTSQVILIDNHSCDGTAAWLRQRQNAYRQVFDDLTVLYNDGNLGFTRAVNQGLALCMGEYILLMNPDVVVGEQTLAVLLRRFEQQHLIGVIAPQLRYPDGRIQPSCRRLPRKTDILLELLPVKRYAFLRDKSWKMFAFDHAHTRRVEQPQGAFLLIRRRTLQQVGRWDERFFMFFSDVDWCRRVLEMGWQIWFVADTFVYHKKGASVYRARPAMLVSSHRAFISYFDKYDRNRLQKIGTKVVYFFLLMMLVVRLCVNLFGGMSIRRRTKPPRTVATADLLNDSYHNAENRFDSQ